MNCGHWNVLNYRQIRTPFKLWSETIRSPTEATAFRTLILIMWSEHEDCAAWRLWQSWETSWYFLIITAIKENCMVSIYIKQYSSIFISMKKSKVSVLVCVCVYLCCKSSFSCNSWFSSVWAEIFESWFWIFCLSSLISSFKELMVCKQITEVIQHKIRGTTRLAK